MCILLLRQEVHCSPLRKETGDSSRVCTSHSKRPFIKQYSLRASLVAQMVKNLCAMQVDLGSIPESARSPDEENGNPLQYSCLENSRDRGAWRATVHGVTKSPTQLSDFTFLSLFQYCCLGNPTDRGAWWAIVRGVTKESDTT